MGHDVRSFSLLLLAALGGALTALPSGLEAQQYFGRNKVQYETFQFQVLRTEHFDIYFYEEEREAALQAGRMAERWYARISRVLDHELRGRQPVVLYANHPHFEQTNAVPGQIGESTGGVTELLKRRIVLPLAATVAESDHVLGHEIVHAFQFDMTGQGPNSVGLDIPVALRMPLWFIEGMAEFLSIGSEDPFTAQWMRGAILADRLPSWGELNNPRFFPYRYGHAFWAYVSGRFGDDAVGELLRVSARAGSMEGGFLAALGVPPDSLVADWHAALKELQGPVLEATSPADSFAREVAGPETTDTQQNIGPALSPDGRWLVFASEKNLFSIELFLYDMERREIVRKITETARDPHFESLQWLSSSGAWAPDGRRFAFGGVVRGQPVVTVIEPHTGRKVQEVRLRQLGEIFNPTWGPDGRRVAFTAQVGGFSDLYVLDLETERLRRITEDPFAELHPAWSPDGRRIAIVTDRFGADLPTLRMGPYRLALVDPGTGAIEPLPAFDTGKHINPQWSPDGRNLFFVSDRNGVSNLYRLRLADGSFHQITNLHTGISGITALSPSLTVARERGSAVFSVHGKGNFVFNLYAVGGPGPGGEGEGERASAGGETPSGPSASDGFRALPVLEASAGAPRLPGVGGSRELRQARQAQEVPRGLVGIPVERAPSLAGLEPGKLPPRERTLPQVDRLLANEELGLADPITFDTRGYSPKLSLDFVGQPSVAVGSSGGDFVAGGGGSLFFSDMLGNHTLATVLQVDGSNGKLHQSTAILGNYTNRKHRWNWGVVAGQLPIITRQFGLSEVATPQGSGLLFQEVVFWQVERQITALLQYPFNRSFRFEVTGSFTNTDFASRVEEVLIAPNGQVVDDRTVDFAPLDTLESLNQGRISAALVYDNSIFGATAPMDGQRFRLQVTPQAGTLNYYSVLGDFRKYWMPVFPFTLAAQVMHFGRYGGDSGDNRLSDLFIGYSNFVRGYDAATFDTDECPVTSDVSTVTTVSGFCPAFDQLIGNRVGVAKVEARLPFLGGVGIIPARNVPPIDLFAFFDSGVAWTRGTEPKFLGGDREIVKSAGVGARMNVFGLLILELDYVQPFDRDDQSWFVDLSILPGF